jgi:hypothetical protein
MMQPLFDIRDQQLDSTESDDLMKSGLFILMLCGFAETNHIRQRGIEYEMSIISRVSCKRAGARFLARGIDDDGNVSNFVETEYIIKSPRHIFSFLQIRGSIPLFWEQTGIQMTHKIEISRGPEATLPATRKHLEDLLDRYSHIHIVSLLKQDPTSSESALGNSFKGTISSLTDLNDSVKFSSFDFNAIIGRDNYANVKLHTSFIDLDHSTHEPSNPCL